MNPNSDLKNNESVMAANAESRISGMLPVLPLTAMSV